MDTKRLIAIAEDLGLTDVVSSLEQISSRSTQADCPILLPLVGEFSAGKTTLVNALTDSRQLETATTPTTAVVYEIRFGAKECYADVFDMEGNLCRAKVQIQDLKNSELNGASLVKVYDTSASIPSSVILADTPGLSSPDSRHRQALVDYLPKADGILLVSDINQQITASLLDFVKTAEIANRPVFLVLTMCDVKSEGEVEQAKQYASEISGIAIENIAAVSALKGNLKEFYCLIEQVQKRKSYILNKVDSRRLDAIKQRMLSVIGIMSKASYNPEDIAEQILEYKTKLNTINRQTDSVISSAQAEIEEISSDTSRGFENHVYEQLDSLASSTGIDFDTEAKKIIDTALRLYLYDYKTSAQNVILSKARQKIMDEISIDLSGDLGFDVSEMNLGSIPYNLNLNELGHEYDKKISTGLRLAVDAGFIAATAGGGAAATAGKTAGTAVKAAKAAKATSTATKALRAYTALEALKKGAELITPDKKSENQTGLLEVTEAKPDKKDGGIYESLTRIVTDQLMGKPQRRRAIHQYVEMTLGPSFKLGLKSITSSLVNILSEAIQNAVSGRVEEITAALSSARTLQAENKEDYRQKMQKLESYRNEIESM